MPEGHKTHFLARQHTGQLADQSLDVSSPQGRFADDAKLVNGRMLLSVAAAGKHLFYEFEGGAIVHVHLGRYGSFAEHPSPPPPPVGQVRMRMIGRDVTLDLRGPTRCRVIDDDQRSAVRSKLGPDPLAGGRKADIRRNLTGSAKPIAALLLDQSLVAGVGNIFRAEMLFEANIAPATAGNLLTNDSFERLYRALKRQMNAGLKHGKIVSVTASEAGRSLADVNGSDRFRVYGKTRCPRCDSAIKTGEFAARKLYYCESCQLQT